MAIRRAALLAGAFIFAAVLAAYTLVHDTWRSFSHPIKLSSSNECTESEQATTNPNKMLFISCGGFID